jgi:TPR repeat protein
MSHHPVPSDTFDTIIIDYGSTNANATATNTNAANAKQQPAAARVLGKADAQLFRDIWHAILHNSPKRIERLIEDSGELWTSCGVSEYVEGGPTKRNLLSFAIENGFFDCGDVLLEQGCDPNTCNKLNIREGGEAAGHAGPRERIFGWEELFDFENVGRAQAFLGNMYNHGLMTPAAEIKKYLDTFDYDVDNDPQQALSLSLFVYIFYNV